MTITLRDVRTNAELSAFINTRCAIDAARKRKRLYGKDSEVRDEDVTVYTTVDRPASEFADPISALFRRIEGGRGVRFGDSRSTLSLQVQFGRRA